jgi:hypothetical protein
MRRIIILVWMMLLGGTVAFAQEVPTSPPARQYASYQTGFNFTYPYDWYAVETAESGGLFTLTNSRQTLENISTLETLAPSMFIITFLSQSTLANIGQTHQEVADYYLAHIPAETAALIHTVENVTLGATEAIFIRYESSYSSGMVVSFENNGLVGYASIDAAVGELKFLEAIVYAMFQTLQPIFLDEQGYSLLTNEVELTDLDLMLQLPIGWSVQHSDGFGYVVTNHPLGLEDGSLVDSLVIFIDRYATIELMPNLPDDVRDAVGVIETLLERDNRIGEVRALSVNGVNVAFSYDATAQVVTMATLINPEEVAVFVIAIHAESNLTTYERVLFPMVASVGMQPTELSSLPFINVPPPLLVESLQPTYTNRYGITFDYPIGFTVADYGAIVMLVNTGNVTDFLARQGEQMFVISAVPTTEQAQLDVMLSGLDAVSSGDGYDLLRYAVYGELIELPFNLTLGEVGQGFQMVSAQLTNAQFAMSVRQLYHVHDPDQQARQREVMAILLSGRLSTT